MLSCGFLVWCFVSFIGIAQDAARTSPAVKERADFHTVITEDTILEPSRDYGRLVIDASNITIDGRGILLKGKDELANKRQGVAIISTGQSNVTLKNIKAHQWETGLEVVDGNNWTIENCDFSDNFHDPEFGWGENGRRGGIVLKNVHHSKLRKNRANRVWDACVLVDSDNNTLEENDFSHTSNTCLKLWHSSGNHVSKNVLSHGIRMKSGEVHARDSTSVLIESGSNGNHSSRTIALMAEMVSSFACSTAGVAQGIASKATIAHMRTTMALNAGHRAMNLYAIKRITAATVSG